MRTALKVVPFAVAFATLMSVRPARAVTDTYTFRDTLQSSEGGATGNTLVPTFNNGTLVSGTFATVAIDANACANTPTVRGYSFPQYGGLKSLNAAPVVVTEAYTISMIVKFSPLKSGYSRLIDFSNSTLDDGIYVLNGGISFYPVGTYAAGSFADNRFSVMTITRNSTTNEVSLFIGLTAAGVYVDTAKKYVLATGNPLFVFMDNTTGAAAISESSPGVVTFLRVSDQPITSTGLAASIDQACQAVACGNTVLETAEGCDDGNNVDGDGCSKDCKIENGVPCNSGGTGVTGAASCKSNICDTDGKCGYVNGAGSTCDGTTASTVCRSGSCGTSSLKCVPTGGCFVDNDCTATTCNTLTLVCVGSADAGADASGADASGADASGADAAGADASGADAAGTDAGGGTDAGANTDAGGNTDGGATDDDAATAGETDSGNGNATTNGVSAGCSCDTASRGTSLPAVALFVAGALVATRRRSKRRSR
jgi:MYXO-CTERM domain-containing protein